MACAAPILSQESPQRRGNVSAIRAPLAHIGLGAPAVVSRAVWCSISASSSAPIRMTMAEIQSQVMKPITAPRDPYVSLNLPKFAAYHENKADAASHRRAAKALPRVIQRQRGFSRLGPYR